MRTWVAAGLGIGLTAGIVGVPIAYRSVESVRYRNLRVVHEGRVYRSGQMPTDALGRVVRELGVGTVITFRDTRDDDGDFDDKAEVDYCAANGIAFHRIPTEDWSPVNGVVPGERTVTEFLRILDDPRTKERAVLFHCFAGIHRTGAHCAVYRMTHDGWQPADAIAEMKRAGTPRTTFADNLVGYLSAFPATRPTAAAVVGGPALASVAAGPGR